MDDHLRHRGVVIATCGRVSGPGEIWMMSRIKRWHPTKYCYSLTKATDHARGQRPGYGNGTATRLHDVIGAEISLVSFTGTRRLSRRKGLSRYR